MLVCTQTAVTSNPEYVERSGSGQQLNDAYAEVDDDGDGDGDGSGGGSAQAMGERTLQQRPERYDNAPGLCGQQQTTANSTPWFRYGSGARVRDLTHARAISKQVRLHIHTFVCVSVCVCLSLSLSLCVCVSLSLSRSLCVCLCGISQTNDVRTPAALGRVLQTQD